MSDLILFWHRRDLRITDNLGLAMSRRQTPKVAGIFCLDPDILQQDDIASVRVTYLIGCLQDLQQSYAQAGSQLLILQGNPSQVLPNLATTLQAKAVFWNLDVEPYAKQRDQQVTEALQQQAIAVQTFWDQPLHSPDQILTGNRKPYTVYTPFWKNWSQQPKPAPVETLAGVTGLTALELEQAQQCGVIPLPTAKALGFIWEQPLPLVPGELAAQTRVDNFFANNLATYQEARNFPGTPGTAQISAALKLGVISLRSLWAKTVQALQQTQENKAIQSIETWQKELVWREFYQHALYHYPELQNGAFRELFQNFPWENNPDYFQAWCQGKTGYPIIDAAMRQLNQTGWMHNRCRMIVASFLTKDLIINWQWGEKYFMQHLIDGDLAANNGGWQWSASSGMDPKPLRIFNPASQAEKFDAEAVYIRQWVPELKHLDTKSLITGNISPLERAGANYPQPIVDHHQRQQQFKELYNQQKQIVKN